MKQIFILILLFVGLTAYSQTKTVTIGNATAGITESDIGDQIGDSLTNMKAGIFNVLDYGAVGDGVTDDAQEIQAAITAAGDSCVIYFPAGVYRVTTGFSISNKGVEIRGSNMGGAVIEFDPATVNDTVLIVFSEDNCGINNLTIASYDYDVVKIGIKLIDVSYFKLNNVEIYNWHNTADSTCIGLQTHGRDVNSISNFQVDADIPIYIKDDPSSNYDLDHFHFSNIFLKVNQIGSIQPCIKVDPGVNITNLTFDGYQSWNRGKYGFYWVDDASGESSENI